VPLTGQETFKAKLQQHNRFAVPVLLRWQYKMEPGELLRVSLKPFGSQNFNEEEFLAKTASDLRLTVPKLTMEIFERNEQRNLSGAIFEVTICPVANRNNLAFSEEYNSAEN
jgi:hypothetical protein